MAMATAAMLAGCGGSSTLQTLPPQESFTSAATFSRMFDARAEQTCEAARRALLSQGYIIDTSRKDLVEGNKNFQPEAERHLQMHIRVVCAAESADGKQYYQAALAAVRAGLAVGQETSTLAP